MAELRNKATIVQTKQSKLASLACWTRNKMQVESKQGFFIFYK